ncbi:MAG: hypothetical protein CMD07_06040 [Flavobacteriales bacterium]|nr:hypothetical protein [Flavobacteriales bacterium]|tara:strand:- start:1019 stop:1672 length:654 start_codon:yes stop_codon:yes gene_type:complete
MILTHRRNNCILLIIIFFHAIGGIGLSLENNKFFLDFTPIQIYFNFLIFSFLTIRREKIFEYIFFSSVIFSLGLFIEIIGVKTQYIFGNYRYGSVLGYSIYNVPITIGLNWLLLSYISSGIIQMFKLNIKLKFAIASLIMVLLDYLIEPVAVNLKWWYWDNINPPILNFIAWFLISYIIQVIIYFSRLKFNKKTSLTFLLSQILLFLIINIKFYVFN